MQINSHAITPSQDGSAHSRGWAAGVGAVAAPSGFHRVPAAPQWHGVPLSALRSFCRGFRGPMCVHRGVPVATSRYFCWDFEGPACTPQVRGPTATPCIPEAGHWAGTPGLRAVLQCAGHVGWDSRTWGRPPCAGGGGGLGVWGGVPGLA